MLDAFNPRKAAQVIAFLVQGRGGRTDIIDVIKLAYLSDRSFLDKYDRPILYDDFYCLDNGPVDSQTYDAIKEVGKLAGPWTDYLRPRRGHEIATIRKIEAADFDLLSVAEELVMASVLEEHKHRHGFELVEWIHENCREWSNPRNTSVPLPYFEVWKALGRENLDEMERHWNDLRNIAKSIQI